MESVFIPEYLYTTVRVETREGSWINGKWVKEKDGITEIGAVYMPVSPSTLKKFPAGAITLEDMSLFTKDELKLKDIVFINGKEWYVYQKTDYGYIADLKFYILRRSNKDD